MIQIHLPQALPVPGITALMAGGPVPVLGFVGSRLTLRATPLARLQQGSAAGPAWAAGAGPPWSTW